MFGETRNHKALSPGDVGTRIEHLMELQDFWNTAYGILTAKNTWHSTVEIERAKQLQTALDLLQNVLEKEYNFTIYAIEINDLPKNAKEIPDAKKDGPTDLGGYRNTV